MLQCFPMLMLLGMLWVAFAYTSLAAGLVAVAIYWSWHVSLVLWDWARVLTRPARPTPVVVPEGTMPAGAIDPR